MKKILGIAAFLFVFAVSIAPSQAEPVYGLIYKDATEAGVGFSPVSACKSGTATCTSYFGIVGLGNYSVNEAAKKAKIKNVSYYDTHTLNILGFKRVTVNVYGN